MNAIEDDDSKAWLTLHRLGTSQFFEYAFFKNKDFWNTNKNIDMTEWFSRVMQRFAYGRCYDLAAAAALKLDFPIFVIRSRHPPVPDAIMHAALLDPSISMVYDILGARPASYLVDEMKRLDDPVFSVEFPAYEPDFDADIRAMITGLPWFPGYSENNISFSDFVALSHRIVQSDDGLYPET